MMIKFIKTYRSPLLYVILIAMMILFFFRVVLESLVSRDLLNYMFMTPTYFLLLGRAAYLIKNMLSDVMTYGTESLKYDEGEE